VVLISGALDVIREDRPTALILWQWHALSSSTANAQADWTSGSLNQVDDSVNAFVSYRNKDQAGTLAVPKIYWSRVRPLLPQSVHFLPLRLIGRNLSKLISF
jgi:hypothetical protein